MMSRNRCLVALALALVLTATASAGLTDSLKQGTPEIKSMGALAFGPEGVLFVADTRGGAIFALATDDTTASEVKEGLKVASLNEKIASLLGIESKQLKINDLAINPISTNAYLTVSRGTGADAPSVLVKVDRKGKISEVALKDVKFARVAINNVTTKNRQEAITSMAYLNGKLFVAGLSNEEFASNLRVIPVPFKDSDKGTGIKIYHGAHGRFETASPVRTFIPYDIKGEAHLLAAYTCTPLVKLPVSKLAPGQQITGTTVAELGNGNRPLDMVMYQKNGKDYLLLSNSRRGLMKIDMTGVDKIEGITDPIRGGKTAGLKYETIKGIEGIEQMAKLDNARAVVLSRSKDALNLETIDLP